MASEPAVGLNLKRLVTISVATLANSESVSIRVRPPQRFQFNLARQRSGLLAEESFLRLVLTLGLHQAILLLAGCDGSKLL